MTITKHRKRSTHRYTYSKPGKGAQPTTRDTAYLMEHSDIYNTVKSRWNFGESHLRINATEIILARRPIRSTSPSEHSR